MVVVIPLFFFFFSAKLHIQFILNFVLSCFSYDYVTYKSTVTLDATVVTPSDFCPTDKYFCCYVSSQVSLSENDCMEGYFPPACFVQSSCCPEALMPRQCSCSALNISLIFHSPFPWTLADKESLSSKCSQCFI